MNVNGKTVPEATAYLIKKGWKHLKTGDAWQWQMDPCPAQYKIEDAVSLQESWDRNRNKTKGTA